MAEFLQQSFWRQEGYFYYDFLLRDFFRYLLGRSNGYVFAPGTSKLIALGDAWYSRCESARDRAIKACEYEYSDYVIRSEEHTSELQSLMRISYAVFCLKKKKEKYIKT